MFARVSLQDGTHYCMRVATGTIPRPRHLLRPTVHRCPLELFGYFTTGLLLKPKFIHLPLHHRSRRIPAACRIGLFKKLTSFFPVAYRGNP